MTPAPVVDEVELIHVRLPLVRPFASRLATRTHKDALVVRVRTVDGAIGWGECAAEMDPTYAPEHLDGAWLVIRDHLAPRLLAGAALTEVAGNHMAKAAIEMAVLDAALRTLSRSLRDWLGGVRTHVDVGVVVERYDDPARAADVAARHAAEGYRRVKLKVARGADAAHTAAVRAALPPHVALWADANGAYTLEDAEHLDALGVDLIEQPLRTGDLLDHVALQGRIRTHISLDESISSVDDARLALHLGAADSLAIKPGRLGGLRGARAVHDLCVAAGVPVWCGGMLETGIGRAANLALCSLEGFTLPGDVSATARYFAEDLTAPFTLDADGRIAVPRGPGLGIDVDESRVAACTVRREVVSSTGG